MRKHRLPLAALVISALVVGGLALAPTTKAATAPTFEAKFDTPSDFFDRFDYGLSGVAQSAISPPGRVNYHGDHDSACEGPDTHRDVHLTGTGPAVDFSQLFWWCAPNGPDTGHVMTGLDTAGYNHLWFSPKQSFTGVSAVCWDLNENDLSSRKWTEVQFVGDADAHQYPTGSVVDSGVWARGTGGFDLGYTDIGFRGGTSSGPTTGLVPRGGDLAGLKVVSNIYSYFQNQDQGVADQVGWPGNLGSHNTDKATRYKHCLSNNTDGTSMTATDTLVTGQARSMTMPGHIPQNAVRVVFHDSEYDGPKADNYDPEQLTWHWDNIQVYTDGVTPTTTTSTSTTSTSTSTTSTSTTSTTTPPTVYTYSPTDPALIAKLERDAAKKGMTVEEYIDWVLHHRYRLPIPGS